MSRLPAALALLVLASSTPALADDSKVDAKALMQTGVKLLEAKDYRGALAVFEEGYKRFASAKILLNIGTTLKLLDRKADAANAYQHYLDSSDADPAKRDEVAAVIAELDRDVGRLAITATPADAEIQVGDGDWLPAAQVHVVRTNPGEVALHARKDGYVPRSQTATSTVGAQTDVAVALDLVPPPVARPIENDHGMDQLVEHVDAGPRSPLGAIALAHLDVANKGAAALVGLTFDVTSRLEVRGAAILGPSYGGYAGASFAFLTDQIRPMVSAGVPVFASNGARWSIRGAGGVEIVASRHLSLIVELGVEHSLNPEMGIKPTLFVPAIGAAGRL